MVHACNMQGHGLVMDGNKTKNSIIGVKFERPGRRIFLPRSYRETIGPAEIGVKSICETKQNVRVVSEIVFLHQSLTSKSMFSDMLVFP